MKPDHPAAIFFAFLVYFAIFVPLETLIPHRSKAIFRKGFATDLLHFFLNGFLRKVALAALVIPIIYLLGFLVSPSLQARVVAQPWWLQLAEAILIQEVGAYWGHRLSHRIPFLWRFHAVHHSPEQLDWLAATHLHPFDQAFIRTCGFIPLYLLGFSKATFGIFIVIEAFNAIFIHSNIRFRCRWLEFLVATPAFHHWHHTNDGPEFHDKNFAGLLPFMDQLFGTFHLPKDKMPDTYGIGTRLPDTYLGQILYPFTRPKRASNT